MAAAAAASAKKGSNNGEIMKSSQRNNGGSINNENISKALESVAASIGNALHQRNEKRKAKMAISKRINNGVSAQWHQRHQ